MNRSPRTTKRQLAEINAHQAEVIARLFATGDHDIASRLSRCQQARRDRQPGRYPWRCRSAGCFMCRRNLIRKWWQAFRDWLPGPAVSLLVFPIIGDPISTARRLRKGLRDVRDRIARRDYRWRAVTFAGLADGGRDQVLVLIRHPGIDRPDVLARLERRWPEVVLSDPGNVEPSCRMTVANAAVLARRRRGVEPLRIVVMPQVKAIVSWDEPMPTLF